MKRVIWKYPIRLAEGQRIRMPHGARILSIQEQHGELCLWALVNPSEPALTVQREFAVVGTGHPVPEDAGADNHVATVVTAGGALVWHVFDLGERPA